MFLIIDDFVIIVECLIKIVLFKGVNICIGVVVVLVKCKMI